MRERGWGGGVGGGEGSVASQVNGVGQDGGPAALALDSGVGCPWRARPDPHVRRSPPSCGAALAGSASQRLRCRPGPGGRAGWGPKRATSTVPRARQTWVVWSAQ